MSDAAPTDHELLDRHARHGDQAAFAEIVRRHVNLVHSAALRQVRSPHLAEEVAQSVFADLARSARRLPPGTVLPAWLWSVARRTAVDAVRREARRRAREQTAHELSIMNTPAADWSQVAPLLDEALQSLDEADRTVMLLRWFENKSMREVGAALGLGEDAAQKRASRALDRLREWFTKRGVTMGAGGLAAALSANAVQVAPAGLAAAVIGGVLASGAATTSWLATLLASFLAMTNATKVILAIVLLAAAAAIPAYRYWQPAHQAARPVVTAKAQSITPSGQAADRVAEPPPAPEPEPAANTVDPAQLQAALENLLAQQQADALAAAVTTARTFVTTGSRTSFGTYKIDMGDYPTTAEGLQVLIRPLAGMADSEPIRWHGPYIAVRRGTPDPLMDPWGNPYQYAYPGTHNPPNYDLWSMGPDGLSGTADDIGNWQP